MPPNLKKLKSKKKIVETSTISILSHALAPSNCLLPWFSS